MTAVGGGAADGTGVESAGDVWGHAGAVFTLAVESVVVVFGAGIGGAGDGLTEQFGGPVFEPFCGGGEFSVILDIDDVVGVLIPHISGRDPSIEAVFEDHEIGVTDILVFSGGAADFVAVARFPSIGTRADGLYHDAFFLAGVITHKADVLVDGGGADVLLDGGLCAVGVFDNLCVALVVVIVGIAIAAADAQSNIYFTSVGWAVCIFGAADAFVNGIDGVVAVCVVGEFFVFIVVAGLVVVGPHEDFGASVVVNVGDNGCFDGSAGAAASAEEDFSGFSVIDACEAFVGIDGFGLTVAVEVEE